MFTSEDYVSLETAKMLKEKGFDNECDYYISEDGNLFYKGILRVYNKIGKVTFFCPTLYEALKWLRNTYNIHLCVQCTAYIKRCKKYDYICEIMDLLHHRHENTLIYHSYEQALEEGIREALKLI